MVDRPASTGRSPGQVVSQCGSKSRSGTRRHRGRNGHDEAIQTRGRARQVARLPARAAQSALGGQPARFLLARGDRKFPDQGFAVRRMFIGLPPGNSPEEPPAADLLGLLGVPARPATQLKGDTTKLPAQEELRARIFPSVIAATVTIAISGSSRSRHSRSLFSDPKSRLARTGSKRTSISVSSSALADEADPTLVASTGFAGTMAPAACV